MLPNESVRNSYSLQISPMKAPELDTANSMDDFTQAIGEQTSKILANEALRQSKDLNFLAQTVPISQNHPSLRQNS